MDFNFNLDKGQTFNLSKDAGLDNIRVELRWNGDADLDVEAFLLDDGGTITRPEDFVFYNSECREVPFDKAVHGNKRRWMAAVPPMSADGAVKGSLDVREGGLEVMHLNLMKVDPDISEIDITASIHEGGTFKDVANASIAIIDEDADKELCRYELNEDFTNETTLVAGAFIVNEDGDWSFKAVGNAYEGGLQALVNLFT